MGKLETSACVILFDTAGAQAKVLQSAARNTYINTKLPMWHCDWKF